MTVSSEPRLFYLRDAYRRPIGAIAFTVEPADNLIASISAYAAKVTNTSAEERDALLASRPVLRGYAVRFTATLCHPDDQFEKKKGRVRTLGRLQSFLSACVAAPQDGGPGTDPPPLYAKMLFRLLRLPVREEIDWGLADALLTQQLRIAYEKVVAADPNPAPAPRPKAPVIAEDEAATLH